MKQLLLTPDNICTAKYDNEFILRSGIWNYMQISFERKEFEDNNSDYDAFIQMIETMLSGKPIEEKDYSEDPYITATFEQLVQYGVIKTADSEDKEKKPNRVAYICDDDLVEEATFIFGPVEVLPFSEVNGLLPDVLLTKIDYLEYEKACKAMEEKLGGYDRFVVLLSQPVISFLKKFNRIMLEQKKSWTAAFLDGVFATIAAFNPNFSGCFECLEQNGMVRMTNLVNYINYRDNENQYVRYPIQRETWLMLASMIGQIEKINYYDISSPLEGKVLSIYLPNFEVVVEKILRTPTCPACGHISVSTATEYNISTRNVISDVLKSTEEE